MHCIVPFAAASTAWAQAQMQPAELPKLCALLDACTVEPGPLPRAAAKPGAPALELELDPDPELSLSAPHEQAWANACGIEAADGCVPLAAAMAARGGWGVPNQAWGRLTLVHWKLGTEQVSMDDPDRLQLDDAHAKELLAALQPLLAEDGFAVQACSGATWLVSHPMLATLACASLDRVIGRNVDLWLGNDPGMRPVRRLQSEVQMLLHRHPVNEAREAAGLPPVNSFWLDGCGVWPAHASEQGVVVDQGLRRAALSADLVAWQQAWQALDATRLAEAVQRVREGLPVAVSLCGERRFVTLRVPGARAVTGPGARSDAARSSDGYATVGSLLRRMPRWPWSRFLSNPARGSARVAALLADL